MVQAKKGAAAKLPSKSRQRFEAFTAPLAAMRWIIGVFLIVGSFFYGLGYFSAPVNYELYMDKFQRVGGEAHVHFLVVDKSFMNNRALQRYASRRVCEQAGQKNDCEVYIFSDASQVPEHLPLIRGKNDVVGMYKYKEGNADFRLLHDGDYKEPINARIARKETKYQQEMKP